MVAAAAVGEIVEVISRVECCLGNNVVKQVVLRSGNDGSQRAGKKEKKRKKEKEKEKCYVK